MSGEVAQACVKAALAGARVEAAVRCHRSKSKSSTGVITAMGDQ